MDAIKEVEFKDFIPYEGEDPKLTRPLPTRPDSELKVLGLLKKHSDLTSTEIRDTLNMSQPNLSRIIMKLKKEGLVEQREKVMIGPVWHPTYRLKKK